MRKRKLITSRPLALSIKEAAEKLRTALNAAEERKWITRTGFIRADAGVRPVVRPSHLGWVGNHNSRRFGSIQFESLAEHDFLNRAEIESDYSTIIRQPVVIAWIDGRGIERHHIPDFGAVRLGRPTLVEVKLEKQAVQPKIRDRTEILRGQFAEFGVDYELVTDAWFRAQPARDNARLLALGRPYEVIAEDIEAVKVVLKRHRSLDAWTITEELGEAPQFIYNIYAMCIDGYIKLANPSVSMRDCGRLILA